MKISGNKRWRVLKTHASGQAAEMMIPPGQSEGGPDNLHPRSDQWMYVIAGRGVAILNGKKTPLTEGVLLLIPKGVRHQIQAAGRSPLRTLNFYSPPAY